MLSPTRFFVLFGLVFGLLMCLIQPPFGVADEFKQFCRAWSVSSGHLIDTRTHTDAGQLLPSEVIQTAKRFYRKPAPNFEQWFAPIPPGQVSFQSNRNYVLYSPVGYLPQVLGIWTGKWLGMGVMGCFYLARVMALLVFVALVGWAIRRVGPYDWIFAVVALLPMTLSEAASCTADSLTLALCFALTAMLLNPVLSFMESRRETLRSLLLLLLLSLSKIGYLILGLLGYIHWNTITPRKRWLTLGLLLAGLGAALCWINLVKPLYLPLDPNNHIAPGAQIQATVQQPLDFLAKALTIVYRAFLKGKQGYYQIIGILGWLDVPLPGWVYATYIPIFLLLPLSVDFSAHPGWKPLGWVPRVWICTVLTLGTLIIFWWLYASYNAVGNTKIEGLQGRYFLPFLAPFLISLSWSLLCVQRWMPLLLGLPLLAVWVQTLLTVSTAFR